VSRSSKAIKGRRKVAAKKARRAVKRRGVPERMRMEDVAHGAGNYGTNGSRDNAGPQAGEAVALATNVAPKMNDQSGRSDPLRRANTVARATVIYPQATATALAALQAWFLLPLRNLQSWQEAWFRLLPPLDAAASPTGGAALQPRAKQRIAADLGGHS
jgi:hypothetical protein